MQLDKINQKSKRTTSIKREAQSKLKAQIDEQEAIRHGETFAPEGMTHPIFDLIND